MKPCDTYPRGTAVICPTCNSEVPAVCTFGDKEAEPAKPAPTPVVVVVPEVVIEPAPVEAIVELATSPKVTTKAAK